MSELSGNWNFPTPTRFGVGRIAELPQACRELGMKRPLMVTDIGLAPLPIVAGAVDLNAQARLATGLFSDVQGNPVGANVEAGVAAFRDGDHDGVIAFGGGSALDVGKAVALMAGQTRPLWDFEDVGDNYTRVHVPGMAPVVAVPTTSGTGSEVGRCSVITDERDHTKKIIFHPGMMPGRVICDPALTVGLPAKITAAVGLDALSHNLEALCAPGFHPMADGIAVQGIRLVRSALVAAYDHGGDLDARSRMMAASTMGATAFQKGLGAMHAMAHPIGAVIGAHHGLTNAVVMPYVLIANRPAVEDTLSQLARSLGLANATFTGFLDWVLALRERLGIPHSLEAIGVTHEHVDDLAPRSVVDPSATTNPIAFDVEGYKRLYRAALNGAL